MTVEGAASANPGSSPARWIAAALVVLALASIGGWLYTVRELNRLAAYRVVGAEALRLANAKGGEKIPAPAIYARKWE